MIALNANGLGAAIREGRQQRRWSQQELANKMGVSRQWIISAERGSPTAQIHLVLEALRWVGYVVDLIPESPDEVLESIVGRAP